MAGSKSPLRQLFLKTLAIGLALIAMGVVMIALGGESGGVFAIPAMSVGLLTIGAGWLSGSYAAFVELAKRVEALKSRGALQEAEDALAQSGSLSGASRSSALTMRAGIAFLRGDAAGAEALASQALAVEPRIHERHMKRALVHDALGMRVLARAAQGKAAEAREDVAAIRADPDWTPQVRARAHLAELMLAVRTGDRQMWSALLRDNAQWREYLGPRVRLLLRSISRALQATERGVYRIAATAAHGGGAVGEWIGKIAPDASAYVEERQVTERPPSVRPKAVQPGTSGSTEISRRAADRQTVRGVMIGLLMAAAIIAMLFAKLGFSGAEGVNAMFHGPLIHLAAALGPVLAAGMFVWAMRDGWSRPRELARAAASACFGDRERGRAELLRAAQDPRHQVSSGAHQALGALKERKGDFVAALEHVDKAIDHLSRNPRLRKALSDLHVPALIAQRAALLAILGRPQEADAELALLEHARFRVRLMQACRAGQLERAAEIARARSVDLSLSHFDETLAGLLEVTFGAAPEGERERVAAELASQPELAAWVEKIAPGLGERAVVARVGVAASDGAASTEEEDDDATEALRARR